MESRPEEKDIHVGELNSRSTNTSNGNTTNSGNRTNDGNMTNNENTKGDTGFDSHADTTHDIDRKTHTEVKSAADIALPLDMVGGANCAETSIVGNIDQGKTGVDTFLDRVSPHSGTRQSPDRQHDKQVVSTTFEKCATALKQSDSKNTKMKEYCFNLKATRNELLKLISTDLKNSKIVSSHQTSQNSTEDHFHSKTSRQRNNSNESFVRQCTLETLVKVSEEGDQKEYFCDFCRNIADYYCENCSSYYCKISLKSLHPAIGPLIGHSVIPVTLRSVTQCCDTHRQPVKLFCGICKRRRCIECVSTTCRWHIFDNNLAMRDIDIEIKSKLVADMENLNKAMSSLDVYKDEVDDEIVKTEMLALYKKERIRQEFVSFHEMLIDREALLCKSLDQEVSTHLSGVWRDHETVFTGLQNDEAHLTSLTVDLLQTDGHFTFMMGTASVQDRYAEMHKKISDFHKTWARNSINKDRELNGILGQSFSLFREKERINESIQHIADGGPYICFHQKTLFVNNPSTPLKIENFVTETALGPSSTTRYKLKLLQGTRHVLWETNIESLQGLLLNTMDTYKFEAGQRYLLKLCPTVMCHMSDQRKQETEHPPSHMIIVVSQTKPEVDLDGLEDELQRKQKKIRKTKKYQRKVIR